MAEEWCDDLAAAIASNYEASGAVQCRYLRRGFNEHFRATIGATELHVRVYLDGKYYIGGDDDFRFELGLADALGAAGCPVARPIPRTDGDFLTIEDVGGQERRVAVFEVAAGEVATEPTVDHAAAIGRAVALVHATIDTVAPSLDGDRYHLDQRYLLQQPLEQLRRAGGEAAELAAIEEIVGQLAGVLEALPKEESDYGIIHADLHLGNMHFTAADRLTIFDLDHSAHGWRAYDFAPLRLSLSDELFGVAVDAYAERRPLPPGIDQIDELVKIRTLWDIGDILAMEAVWGNDDASRQVPDALPKIVARLAR